MTLEVTEEERQMTLLALACLSLDRPGWDDALNKLACKMDRVSKGRAVVYDRLREYRPMRVVLGRPKGSMYERILDYLAEADGAGAAAEGAGALEADGAAES